jgi:hypothetical protein
MLRELPTFPAQLGGVATDATGPTAENGGREFSPTGGPALQQ